MSRSHLYAWPDRPLTPETAERYAQLVTRRAAGEPLAYLTGGREFWSLAFRTTPDVLVPRPETETLVAAALSRIAPGRPCRVADLGTGSGAIAAAIAMERPLATIVATDQSAAALEIARENFERLGLTARIETRAGDWYAALVGERLDCIVSNPPYIAEGDAHLGGDGVRFEPRNALVSGPDGLDAIRTLVAGARQHLRDGGWLIMEHGADQGAAVRALLSGAGFLSIATEPDAAGRERITAAH